MLRRGETLSEGTLSALMEWLARPWGPGGGRDRDPHIWNHFRSGRRWLAVKGESGRLAGERGRQGLTLDIPQPGVRKTADRK